MVWNLKDLEENLLIGSTLVEGSTLSEKEAREVLAGRTVQGHPLSEAREILNYRTAVEWMMGELSKAPFISQDLILSFHARLFQGFHSEPGRWKTTRNYTYLTDGSRYDYEPPEKVVTLIRKWIDRFNHESTTPAHEVGAALYYEFQKIHPFQDGNGRIGRILMAYWFYIKHNLDFRFYLSDKLAHLSALEAASRGDLKALTQFFKKTAR